MEDGGGQDTLGRHHPVRTQPGMTETSRDLLASIVESSEDAIVTKDLQGKVLSWNRGAERIFGYTAQEMVGQPITRLFPPDRLDEEPRIMARIQAGERVGHFQTQRVRKDGTRIDVSVTISPLRDDAGRLVGASKIARDITASKRAQSESALLAAVVQSSSDGICTKDLAGMVTSWNPGCEEMFGYSAAEIIGRPMDLLFPPDRRHEVEGILQAARDGRTILHKETQRLRKDGTLVDVSITSSPLRTDDGTIVGISEVAQDITDRRLRQEAEHERAQAKIASLNEVEAFRSRFVNSAAHELANPLTPIAIQLRVLQRTVKDPQGARSVAILGRNFERVARGIRDLLDAARIEADRLKLERAPLSLRALVQEAAESFEPAAREKGVHLRAVSPAEVVLQGDEGRLMQVLYNLLSNALKFTPPGGTIEVGAKAEAGQARLWVRDDGAGMSSNQLERLFHPYQQVHDPRSQPGGMGLGLYISRALVERHGGRIWAESAGHGKGTTMWVEIPLRDLEDGQDAAA